MIAAREEILKNDFETISKILDIINLQTLQFKSIKNITTILADHFNQKTEDIQEWLSLTEWSQNNLSAETLNKIQNQLFDLKIIDKKGTFAEIVYNKL